jgi:hypothetical protein
MLVSVEPTVLTRRLNEPGLKDKPLGHLVKALKLRTKAFKSKKPCGHRGRRRYQQLSIAIAILLLWRIGCAIGGIFCQQLALEAIDLPCFHSINLPSYTLTVGVVGIDLCRTGIQKSQRARIVFPKCFCRSVLSK